MLGFARLPGRFALEIVNAASGVAVDIADRRLLSLQAAEEQDERDVLVQVRWTAGMKCVLIAQHECSVSIAPVVLRRVARAHLLFYRNRGTDPLDIVYVRFLHPVQEIFFLQKR